jgi:NADH-quinone oxidoreductase subunit N
MLSNSTLLIVAPELLLGLASLVLLVFGAFNPKSHRAVGYLASLTLLAGAGVAATAPLGTLFNGGLTEDSAAVFAKVAIYLASAVTIPLCGRFFERLGQARFELPILVVLAALGMGMMVSAGNLLALYVGLELQSLALYVLAAFNRDDAKASEAGLKYFVLGALSSGLLLYGSSLIYGFAGSTAFADIARASVQGDLGPGGLFGLVFVLAGLAFKVSAAPFHMWTPDVYEGAPTPIVGFFSAAPKLAAIVLMGRVLMTAFPGADSKWGQILVIMSMLSIAVGAFGGLTQSSLKRLWAYSSIANVGYALLGLAAGNAQGVQASMMFMVLYMIDVTGFFACLQALRRDGQEIKGFADVAGLIKERPGLALAMTAFSLSALGLPPFSGFFAKYYVFKAAIGAGLGGFAVAGLVGSVVAAFYYLRLIKTMWFDSPLGGSESPALEPRLVGYGAALFSFPVALVALSWIDPLAKIAASAFGKI